jgi:hypothetical protein
MLAVRQSLVMLGVSDKQISTEEFVSASSTTGTITEDNEPYQGYESSALDNEHGDCSAWKWGASISA